MRVVGDLPDGGAVAPWGLALGAAQAALGGAEGGEGAPGGAEGGGVVRPLVAPLHPEGEGPWPIVLTLTGGV